MRGVAALGPHIFPAGWDREVPAPHPERQRPEVVARNGCGLSDTKRVGRRRAGRRRAHEIGAGGSAVYLHVLRGRLCPPGRRGEAGAWLRWSIWHDCRRRPGEAHRLVERSPPRQHPPDPRNPVQRVQSAEPHDRERHGGAAVSACSIFGSNRTLAATRICASASSPPHRNSWSARTEVCSSIPRSAGRC